MAVAALVSYQLGTMYFKLKIYKPETKVKLFLLSPMARANGLMGIQLKMLAQPNEEQSNLSVERPCFQRRNRAFDIL
ncbi:MAG: hypothetical protein BM558_12450 [Roseobacter sp. MedPE-SW]|nr:MAG: hypothetical protein BM558_12450 [Roseobacter sp. MedPE-SW]